MKLPLPLKSDAAGIGWPAMPDQVAANLHAQLLQLAGQPCAPGEIGRSSSPTCTTSRRRSSYEIRDYAEAGPACPCGRGLPTLTRIMGRRRNMVVFPDGRKHWPLIGSHDFRAVADIRQY